MTPERKIFRPATSNDVCQTYELLHKEGLISFPLTEEARHKVESLVANITGTYFGIEPYPTTEEKAVAYLYFIIKNHPFTDGNKRTASLVFSIVCTFNGLSPKYPDFGLDALAVFVEKIQEPDHQTVIRLI